MAGGRTDERRREDRAPCGSQTVHIGHAEGDSLNRPETTSAEPRSRVCGDIGGAGAHAVRS
jgi:hypothetical protein